MKKTMKRQVKDLIQKEMGEYIPANIENIEEMSELLKAQNRQIQELKEEVKVLKSKLRLDLSHIAPRSSSSLKALHNHPNRKSSDNDLKER